MVDIEAEFRRLEASQTVDQELEKLKAAMLPPSKSMSSVRLPGSSAARQDIQNDSISNSRYY